MLNTLPSSPKEVTRFLPAAYSLRLPVFLWGRPGIGKSDLIRQFAREQEMDLIDLRLTTLESCDLRGLPRINHETGITEWMRPEFLPTIDTPVVLFLDELTAAEPRIQASAYQLILDRCIGAHRLPDQAWVVGAGNAPDDGAVSYGMGTALADRFVHIKVVANPQDWMEWALDHGIAPEVITFLRVRPEMLDSSTGQAQTEQIVTPSPRSWARVSRLLNETKDSHPRPPRALRHKGPATRPRSPMSAKTRATTPAIATHTVTIDVGTYDSLPFLFTFKTDGTGIAEDHQYNDDKVEFTWDPSILEDAEDDIEDFLSEYARTRFWDDLNQQLDDPVLSNDNYGSEELVFESGSSDELERIVRLILYSVPSLWEDDRDQIDVVIRARTESEGAHLDEYCEFMEDPDVPEKLRSRVDGLISLCLQWIDPYGWSMEYNDGAYGRTSGYSASANSLDYTIMRPSFHELAEAREELLQLFARHNLAEDAQAYLPEEGE